MVGSKDTGETVVFNFIFRIGFMMLIICLSYSIGYSWNLLRWPMTWLLSNPENLNKIDQSFFFNIIGFQLNIKIVLKFLTRLYIYIPSNINDLNIIWWFIFLKHYCYLKWIQSFWWIIDPKCYIFVHGYGMYMINKFDCI
jgi:hypothetical protein